MIASGFTERESRPQFRPQDFQLPDLLAPLHVLLTTPAGPEPRELRALEAIERIARAQDPVWIAAEVGAGGVWLAQLLHDHSSAEAPFIREDCEPGRAPNLVDGRGTLFLCGPERLSPAHQNELVEYLRRSDLRHLEGLRTIPPFPRVIAWSLTEVNVMVDSGQILPALAQALGRVQITVPPLRAQRESIEVLARATLEQIAAHEGLMLRRLAPEALAALRAYSWPGNLTELHSLLERACLLADPDQMEIDATDLSITPFSPAKEGTSAPLPAAQHRPRPMSEIEAEAIRASIDWNSGNLVRAARELRIGRATLYRKLKKYGIPTRAQRRQLTR
jgi:DNA-binding NtrC family response regulator